MYAASSPRKAINDIIHNIRQIASNISKDVSSSPQPFQSQPLQDQYPPQRPQTSNYLQDAIEIRNATSTRATVNVEESNLVTQNTSGLAQGIKNAHTKIDQALRFMNDMKSRLEPDRKCFSVNALPSGNKEDMDIKNAQLSYPKSLPILTQTTQETPSLTTLPMAYDELRSSPTNATPTYFAQYDTSRFNPFSKPVVNNMTEMLNLLEQKSVSSNATTQNLMGSIGTANALNFNSSRSIGQMMQSQITSLPRKIPAVPSYMTVNNVAPTGNVDLQRKLLTAASSRPSSANPLQSGCDYNRLNQIVHNIKQKGASQQQLSLNELGSVHSLTSLHDQAAMEYDMMRPNTVSHISTRPPVSAKGFAFPRENNFYQLPQAQYEAVPSHFSSQASMYANNGFRPNTVTSGFLEAVQKATNQLSEGEPSENRYSENHEEDEEFCKPRKLKFEKEKVERNHSRKRTSQHQEEKPVKKRQAEVTQKHRKGPSYQHKPHKVRDTQEIYEKRNNYRDVVQEDDSDSLVDESVVFVCHSRKREPSCHHESCASIQSDEESMEESVRYEIPRGKTVTQRTIETKRSVCANCHCKKVAKQYIVYNTNTSSGRVVRPKRSLSRKQKCSIEEPKVVFDENVTTYESEAHENRTQTLRRNKSIDCNRVRDSMGRKPLGRPRANNENAATADTWTLSKFQKEDQSGKISFESLRRQDENQTNERRYTDHKVNLLRSGARESPNQIYSKVFVDQLALEFPAAKENVTFTNNRVRKTEIIRSNSKVQRRIPY